MLTGSEKPREPGALLAPCPRLQSYGSLHPILACSTSPAYCSRHSFPYGSSGEEIQRAINYLFFRNKNKTKGNGQTKNKKQKQKQFLMSPSLTVGDRGYFPSVTPQVAISRCISMDLHSAGEKRGDNELTFTHWNGVLVLDLSIQFDHLCHSYICADAHLHCSRIQCTHTHTQ